MTFGVSSFFIKKCYNHSMKKFVLILVSLFLMTNTVIASENYGFRGPLNFIQCKILEKTISSQIEKRFKATVDTKIKSYGAKALRNGIFKSAIVQLNGVEVDGISVSEVNVETTSVENRLDITDIKDIKLLSNIDANFWATLSNEDLKNILASKIYQKEIAKINAQIAPFASVKIADVYCEGEQLFIKLQANSFGVKLNTIVSSQVVSENGIVVLKDIKLSKHSNNVLLGSIMGDLGGVNPINTAIKGLGNPNLSIKISSINIVNDKIKISGIIRIYKD